MAKWNLAVTLAVFLAVEGAFAVAVAGDWDLVKSAEPEGPGEGLVLVKKTIRKRGDSGFFANRTLQLVFFDARFFTLRVIDQGTEATTAYRNIAEAMQANFCPVGCNGGFFHPDFRPLGLMIADGRRINKWETSKLLSGVVVADGSGLRLLRRAEFRDHGGIHALLQSGPFLVDGGVAVKGLSTSPSRRRTFLLWDGSKGAAGKWAMGVSTSLTLAELGEVLADNTLISEWKVERALNLDGGSSTGMYFDRGAGVADYVDNPSKRVRNFLGLMPRADVR